MAPIFPARHSPSGSTVQSQAHMPEELLALIAGCATTALAWSSRSRLPRCSSMSAAASSLVTSVPTPQRHRPCGLTLHRLFSQGGTAWNRSNHRAAMESGDFQGAMNHASAAVQEARAELERLSSAHLSKPAVRILSGFAIGGVLGPATFGGGWPFLSLLVLLVYFISNEYSDILDRVLQPKLAPGLRTALWTVSIATIFSAQVGIRTGVFECAAISMLAILLFLQGNARLPNNRVAIQFSHIASQVFGVFYIGYLPAFWIRLRTIGMMLPSPVSPQLHALTSFLHWPLQASVGACATVSCVLCIVAADTCAWAGGRKWGKRPLISVSPRKTVEGAYCGVCGCIAMALLCDWAWGTPAGPCFAATCGLLIFCASLLGDLVVSALKRDAGVKDAGALIPGHGGILDRFDSYFFAAPASYFCWYMLLRARGVPASMLTQPFLV